MPMLVDPAERPIIAFVGDLGDDPLRTATLVGLDMHDIGRIGVAFGAARWVGLSGCISVPNQARINGSMFPSARSRIPPQGRPRARGKLFPWQEALP